MLPPFNTYMHPFSAMVVPSVVFEFQPEAEQAGSENLEDMRRNIRSSLMDLLRLLTNTEYKL